ncbi:MAG: DUF4230 domain-containing protein [Saprospiraceae bacterium]|nr:DUF4230 domain-containing protein [Saprospiraceae bacterium]
MATHQTDGAYAPPDDDGGGGGLGKQLLLIAMLTIAVIVGYKAFFSGGGGLSNLFQEPKEVKMTYVPSDFNPNLDEEKTLRILSQPDEYRREFDQLVYDFNVALLYHVANRMALPDSLKRRLEPEYKKHHDYLKNLYYNDFVAIKDTTAGLYESWYNDHANQAVQVFNEVAGKYTCFFVTQVMATLLRVNGGKFYAKGKNVATPCDIAMHEGLQPMAERLKKKAEIMDFSASRGMLKEKVRKGIAELATYELRSRMGIDKTLQYKIFGFSVSETDIRVEAISVVKAGFKLDQYFDVTLSPKRGTLNIKLPQPTILSHEVYPRVDKLDVGYLAGINEKDMNERFNELRRQFRQDALENEQVLEKAKARADSVMQLMFGPIARSINRNYKIQVVFQDVEQPMTEDELRRRGEEGKTPPKVSSPGPVDAPKRDKSKVIAN